MEENWAMQDVKNALRANASKSAHCVVRDNVKCLNPWDCQSKRQHDIYGVYPTLQAYSGGGGRCDGVCYALKGNYIDRDTKQNGVGWREGEMYVLDATDRHGVVYPETARTLTAEHDGSWCVDKGPNVVCYGVDCRNGVLDEEKTHTIQAKPSGGTSLNCTPSVCYRNSGYGDMVEGVGTLRANGGDVGGGYGEHRH